MKTERIIFEKYVSGQIDDEGVEISVWVEDRKAWAKILKRRFSQGSQRQLTGGVAEIITDVFVINFVPGWTPTTAHRLIHKGEIFDVESVENVGNLEFEIRATRTGRTLAT